MKAALAVIVEPLKNTIDFKHLPLSVGCSGLAKNDLDILMKPLTSYEMVPLG